MKLFITNILIILLTLVLVLTASLLLNLEFIKAFIIRQIVVYVLIAILFFTGFRIIFILNKTKQQKVVK